MLKIENLTALRCRKSNVPQGYHKYSEGLDRLYVFKYAETIETHCISIALVRYICKQLCSL